jgi:sulfoxide reductase heme-binding subunit YedZ
MGSSLEERAAKPGEIRGWGSASKRAAHREARAQRSLGRRWITLHRLVYGAAGCAVVHFLWPVKADLREPLLYAALPAALLAARFPRIQRLAAGSP